MNLFKLLMTKEAEQDVEDIWQYYEEQQKGLGKKMRKQLQNNLKQLRKHPEMYAKFKKDIRRGHLKKFPYSFYYQNDIPEELIRILGVFAQAQDPESIIEQLNRCMFCTGERTKIYPKNISFTD